jgi:prolyl-tRNA synthetase
MPPRLAPIQVVFVPIFTTPEEQTQVMSVVDGLLPLFKSAGIRYHVDKRDDRPGNKAYHWEMRGVPVRIDIGPKDLQNGTAAVARRDKPGKEGKQFLPREGLVDVVAHLLAEIQANMLKQATEFRDSNIHEVTGDYAKFQEIVTSAWAFTWFCGSAECEAKIKEENQCVSRCFPLDQQPGEGPCIACGTTAKERALFAKAY